LFKENYTVLERIAENMTNNVSKVYLKRIDLSNTTLVLRKIGVKVIKDFLSTLYMLLFLSNIKFRLHSIILHMHTILVDINNISTTHVILDESSEISTKRNNVNQ